jgi:hypothetical protein
MQEEEEGEDEMDADTMAQIGMPKGGKQVGADEEEGDDEEDEFEEEEEFEDEEDPDE